MTARIPAGETERLALRSLAPRIHYRESMDARREAERILERARSRAGAMEAEARRRVSGWRRRIRQAEQRRWTRKLGEGLRDVASWREQLLASNRKQILELSRALAERLLGQELRLDPDRVVDICRAVMEEVACSQPDLALRVCPEDAACLRAAQPAFLDAVLLEEDEDLERGDCLLFSPRGWVDARIPLRLDMLTRALAGEKQESDR